MASASPSHQLPSASARGAALRGCSAYWEQCATTAIALSSATVAESAPRQQVRFEPINSTVLSLHNRPPMSSEPPAVRAANNRIALQTHVGPHVGPGSGAPLNFLISRMRTGLERLETYRDGPDTSDSEEDPSS